MPVTQTKKSKKVFTRLTLDPSSLQAVKRVQQAIPNYNLNDAVKMIFGLGISELENILPQTDENGFNNATKTRLLKAKQELEANQGQNFSNPEEVIKYAQHLT